MINCIANETKKKQSLNRNDESIIKTALSDVMLFALLWNSNANKLQLNVKYISIIFLWFIYNVCQSSGWGTPQTQNLIEFNCFQYKGDSAIYFFFEDDETQSLLLCIFTRNLHKISVLSRCRTIEWISRVEENINTILE